MNTLRKCYTTILGSLPRNVLNKKTISSIILEGIRGVGDRGPPPQRFVLLCIDSFQYKVRVGNLEFN